MSVNKVILIGRAGKDPEIRSINSGTTVATFTMATNRVGKNKEGEKTEEAEWHRIVAYSRIGEICRDYLKKGALIFIEGRIKTRQWDDKDSNRRWITEIIAEKLTMLGSREENSLSCEDHEKGGGAFSKRDEVSDMVVPF